MLLERDYRGMGLLLGNFFHHVPSDGPEMTSASLLDPLALASARARAMIEQQRHEGFNYRQPSGLAALPCRGSATLPVFFAPCCVGAVARLTTTLLAISAPITSAAPTNSIGWK